MNIVLAAINAKYIHSNLAVYSLRAYAQQYKDEIQIAEYTINQQIDDILMDLYKKNRISYVFPAIYGTCLMWKSWFESLERYSRVFQSGWGDQRYPTIQKMCWNVFRK